MVCENSHYSVSIELLWICYIKRVHNMDVFNESLELLSLFRFCKNEDGIIKSGPAILLNNDSWLNFRGLPVERCNEIFLVAKENKSKIQNFLTI